MINTTDRLQFLIEGEELHTAVQAAIRRTTMLLEKIVGRPAGPADYQEFAFITMFREGSLPQNKRYDETFLEAALIGSQTPLGSTEKLPAELLVYTTGKSPPGTGFSSLKRGLKLFLVELWRQQALLLPTVFNVGGYFPVEEFSHPLLDWVRAFDPFDKSGSADARRMYYYGPRLLWATNWKTPVDVSISEIATLARARVLCAQGKSAVVIAGGAQLPLGLFPANLIRKFPDEVSYTSEDLARYSNWSLSHSISETPFEDFYPGKRIARQGRVRPAAPMAKQEQRPKYEQVSGDEDSHEVLLRNFKGLKGENRRHFDWQASDSVSYPGREHMALDELMSIWVTCFKAFLHHREVFRGFRSTREVVPSLNILADYLFYYLPWWREVAPAAKVEIPVSPREFSRYAFVARHTQAPWTELPATLLELIRLRRPSNASAKVSIHLLSLFFAFVETHFSDDEAITGPSYKSPLNPEFDAPRIQTKNKTTKVVIPKHIYGYLLFYCYAVEDFGIHLEAMVRSGVLPQNRKALLNALRFETGAFGCTPHVTYRGGSYPLASVPNVFTWAERELALQDSADSAVIYMPHCSVLRLLIVALETGLRAQSVQWLDRASWRSLGEGLPDDSYTYPLLVNTDKTKTNSWRTYVVHRVKKLLEREEHFQTQFADSDAYGPVDYEGLDSSPFDAIRPLFRSANSAYPVSDTQYDRYWKRLMVDFEAFYREATGENHVRMYKFHPRMRDDGTPVVRGDGEAEERAYCPISVLAIHTPHSCRATFATNRKGVLELSDTAELLGHSNVVVTAHYDKPDEADLRLRLQDSDSAIVSDFAQFFANSDVHVRADKTDSALVKSFSKDREATVRAFRFMPSIALWSTDDSKAEANGLQLLREGPMSKIRFRETHICPVGEECPSDILEQIGEPRRCGSCPLAMKCVDHLPAIAAKRNQLLERIKYQHRRREQLEAAGEPAAVLDEVWEAVELDVNELLGWKLSEEVLERMRSEAPIEGELLLHVEKPDVVKRHLQRVTRSSSVAELVLQRIADCNAYPSMTTPQVQLMASQLKRKLLAGQHVDALSFEDDGFSEVKGVAAMLAYMLKSQGISMKQLAAQLAAPPTAAQRVLTTGMTDGK